MHLSSPPTTPFCRAPCQALPPSFCLWAPGWPVRGSRCTDRSLQACRVTVEIVTSRHFSSVSPFLVSYYFSWQPCPSPTLSSRPTPTWCSTTPSASTALCPATWQSSCLSSPGGWRREAGPRSASQDSRDMVVLSSTCMSGSLSAWRSPHISSWSPLYHMESRHHQKITTAACQYMKHNL